MINNKYNPCKKDCQNRGESCKTCNKYKVYEIIRNANYEKNLVQSLSRNAIINSAIEKNKRNSRNRKVRMI